MEDATVRPDSEIDADAFARSVANMRALVAVLDRIQTGPHTVPELVALAPELVCELGFDRGLISRVEDGIWYPELMYIVGDPEWAAEIGTAGKSTPIPLTPGLHETNLVRNREPILVIEAQNQDDTRWGHPAMVAASKTRSYVAAPIMSGTEVVGILTADRYGSGRDVDEIDRDLLAAFAQTFQLAMVRVDLAERLTSAEQLLTSVSRSLGAAGTAYRTPKVCIAREPDDEPGALVVRSRPRTPVLLLPETLTPREIEVLRLMAGGRTNLAIANALFISDGTVKQHVKHILRKLNASSRSEAIVRWFHAGGVAGEAAQDAIHVAT